MSSVRLLGLVPPEEVPAALWAADAVVHAGLREGLARVIPQAGLSRRPVAQLSIESTVSPRARSWSATVEPTCPEPPVMRIFMSSLLLSECATGPRR